MSYRKILILLTTTCHLDKRAGCWYRARSLAFVWGDTTKL